MMRIAIVGGDARMPYAARALGARGHEVSLSAHGELPLSPEAISCAEAVLLPHPLTRDGVHLNAPQSPLPVPLAPLFSMLPRGIPLLCGDQKSGALASLNGEHPLLPYGTQEEFLERNSRITAEGAVSLLLSRLSTALFETPCLVLGSGRLARALLELLGGLRAPVTAFARNPSPIGGVRPLPLGALPAEIGHYPVLINTVPARLLDPPLLRRMQPGAILLELSAAEGVLDEAAARAAGITLVGAPALPGRYAPESAGSAVADAVTAILSQ